MTQSKTQNLPTTCFKSKLHLKSFTFNSNIAGSCVCGVDGQPSALIDDVENKEAAGRD